MRQLVIGSFALLIGLPTLGHCQDAPTRDTKGRQQQVVVRMQFLEVSRTRLHELGRLELPGNNNQQALAQYFGPVNPKTGVVNCAPNDANQLVADLREANVLRVLAEPMVATVDGRPFSCTVGGDVGTRMDGVPTVLGDGKVHLQIRIRHSMLPPMPDGKPQTNPTPVPRVRMFDTEFEIESGKTAVFAGLLQQQTEPKPKGAKDTPPETVETLILITPEIVAARPPLPTKNAQFPATTRK